MQDPFLCVPVFCCLRAASWQLMSMKLGRVSRPVEFHLEPLPEPYVNVSAHTAPTTEPAFTIFDFDMLAIPVEIAHVQETFLLVLKSRNQKRYPALSKTIFPRAASTPLHRRNLNSLITIPRHDEHQPSGIRPALALITLASDSKD